jgi:formylglycine-generating enzyme required for sulfatase activity/WD40 repeat protein
MFKLRPVPVYLRGHEKRINSLNFSPDGQLIATTSNDGTARIFKSDGTQVACTRAHGGAAVLCAAWSRDGSMIATASKDAVIRIWRLSDAPQLVEELRGHSGEVRFLAWTDDGNLFSAGSDGLVNSWGPSDRKQFLTCDRDIVDFRASSDGEFILLAFYSGELGGTTTLCKYNLPAGAEVLRAEVEDYMAIFISPDMKRFLACKGGYDEPHRDPAVYTINPSGRAARSELPMQQFNHKAAELASFSADGKWLATASVNDADIKLWLINDGRKVLSYTSAKGKDWETLARPALALSPDGCRVAVVERDTSHTALLLDFTDEIKAFCSAGRRPKRSVGGEGQKEPSSPKVRADQLWGAKSNEQADQARQPGDVFRDITNAPEMVVIPAGSFLMGSPDTDRKYKNEGPQHEVSVKAFAISVYPVTVGQWRTFLSATRSQGRCWGVGDWEPEGRLQNSELHPACGISWERAQDYVRWLSAQTGRSYRLLSEAEWEYVATTGAPANLIGTGATSQDTEDADNDAPDDDGNNRHAAEEDRELPVGSGNPNAHGVHDLFAGPEWVEDTYQVSYHGAPTDGSAWCVISDEGSSRRVLRGRKFFSDAPRPTARTNIRLAMDKDIRVRVARSL